MFFLIVTMSPVSRFVSLDAVFAPPGVLSPPPPPPPRRDEAAGVPEEDCPWEPRESLVVRAPDEELNDFCDDPVVPDLAMD